MSIPWQRHADEHARTVVTVAALRATGAGRAASSAHAPAVGAGHGHAVPACRHHRPRYQPVVLLHHARAGGDDGSRRRSLPPSPAGLGARPQSLTAAAGGHRQRHPDAGGRPASPPGPHSVRPAQPVGRGTGPGHGGAHRYRPRVARRDRPSAGPEHAQVDTPAHRARTHHARHILPALAGTSSSAPGEKNGTVDELRRLDGPDAPLAPNTRLGRLGELTGAFEPTCLTVRLAGTRDVPGPSKPPSGPLTVRRADSRSPPT